MVSEPIVYTSPCLVIFPLGSRTSILPFEPGPWRYRHRLVVALASLVVQLNRVPPPKYPVWSPPIVQLRNIGSICKNNAVINVEKVRDSDKHFWGYWVYDSCESMGQRFNKSSSQIYAFEVVS